MPVFVALLRGVNVGNAMRVPMAEFRSLLIGLGYTDVATLLNSGNAVFRATKGTPSQHSVGIGKALARELGVEVPVVVKSAKELDAIVQACPIRVDASEHARLLVAFAQDAGGLATLRAVEPLIAPPERFVLGRNAAYAFLPDGILKTRAGDALLGRAGRAVTTRNWATVLKLHALALGAG